MGANAIGRMASGLSGIIEVQSLSPKNDVFRSEEAAAAQPNHATECNGIYEFVYIENRDSDTRWWRKYDARACSWLGCN